MPSQLSQRLMHVCQQIHFQMLSGVPANGRHFAETIALPFVSEISIGELRCAIAVSHEKKGDQNIAEKCKLLAIGARASGASAGANRGQDKQAIHFPPRVPLNRYKFATNKSATAAAE
ncbi:hypothetical protein EVAR_36978_1 [Eumeta japonica]|uniref:Uncharacterized protein n=1 Tax=Eumeta variegata TaxID=151549 RepID=A0A4C1W816_EUMVA|nr:hypothetical protein EVAR_36978_1 [Eumeta japonica]